jgi:hypothetical protein
VAEGGEVGRQRRLARRVGRHPGRRKVRHDGRERHDRALLAHLGQGGVDERDRAEHVDFEEPLRGVGVERRSLAEGDHARAHEEHVEAPHGLGRQGHHLLAALAVGEVEAPGRNA